MPTSINDLYAAGGPQRDPAQQPDEPLTPFQQYLQRQWEQMKAQGKTIADFETFAAHAGQLTPNVKRLLSGEAQAAANAQDAAEQTPGYVRGTGLSLLQGLTFGFGDEIVGTTIGWLSKDVTAQQGRDIYRQWLQAYREAHPVAALSAELVGGLVVPGLSALGEARAAGAVLKAGTLGTSLARAAGAGAAYGAAYGAGEAEGGLSARARGALIGGVAGAATGGAASVAGRTLGAVVRGSLRAPAAALDKAASVSGVQPLKQASIYLEDIARDIPRSPASIARSLLRNAMVEDGVTLNKAVSELTGRESATLADVAGPRMLALAESAQRFQSGQTRELLRQAVEGGAEMRGSVLLTAFDQLNQISRAGIGSLPHATEALMQQRAQQAEQLLTGAYAEHAVVPASLREMLREPIYRDAYSLGASIAHAQDVAGSRGIVSTVNGPAVRLSLEMPTLAEATKAIEQPGGVLPVRAMDFIRHGLDQYIEQRSLPSEVAHGLRSRLTDALNDVGLSNTAYAAARARWVGLGQHLDDIELGKAFFDKPIAQVEREVTGLSGPRLDFYRLGALQSISDKMEGWVRAGKTASNLYDDGKLAVYLGKLWSPDLLKGQQKAGELMDYLANELSLTRMLGQVDKAPVTKAAQQQAAKEFGQSAKLGLGHFSIELHNMGRAQAIASELTRMFLPSADKNELVTMLRALPKRDLTVQAAQRAARRMTGILAATPERNMLAPASELPTWNPRLTGAAVLPQVP